MLNHVHHFRLGFRDVSFCDSEIQVVFFPSPKSGGSQSWWSSRPGWNLESWVLRRCLKNPPPKKMCFTGAHNVSMFCGICGHIVFISKFACVNLHAFCCIMPIRNAGYISCQTSCLRCGPTPVSPRRSWRLRCR